MQGREAVDSMVCENKADSHSPRGERLSLEGTLENLLEIKLHNPEETSPCLKFNPNENLLSSAKKKNSKRVQQRALNKAKNTLKQIICRCCFYLMHIF